MGVSSQPGQQPPLPLLAPMLAVTAPTLPGDPERWAFEVKSYLCAWLEVFVDGSADVVWDLAAVLVLMATTAVQAVAAVEQDSGTGARLRPTSAGWSTSRAWLTRPSAGWAWVC